MTNHRLTSLDLNPFYRNSVGIDKFFDTMLDRVQLANSGSYPPYNIIAETDDKWIVEVAVAGFAKEDIRVTLSDGMLLIDGAQDKHEEGTGPDYLHRGISSRDFQRSFALADYVEVTNALVENGILRVELERLVPEEKKPKQIEIK